MLPDLTVPGHPNVFVIGDMASVPGVPGMAQGAIQGAKYAARAISAELKGATPAVREPFHYFDKGSAPTRACTMGTNVTTDTWSSPESPQRSVYYTRGTARLPISAKAASLSATAIRG